MIKKLVILFLGILIGVSQISAACAGGSAGPKGPPLDTTLMGMKNKGCGIFCVPRLLFLTGFHRIT